MHACLPLPQLFLITYIEFSGSKKFTAENYFKRLLSLAVIRRIGPVVRIYTGMLISGSRLQGPFRTRENPGYSARPIKALVKCNEAVLSANGYELQLIYYLRFQQLAYKWYECFNTAQGLTMPA